MTPVSAAVFFRTHGLGFSAPAASGQPGADGLRSCAPGSCALGSDQRGTIHNRFREIRHLHRRQGGFEAFVSHL